ncbi:MAG: sugar transferase [Rhodothermales bacterium]
MISENPSGKQSERIPFKFPRLSANRGVGKQGKEMRFAISGASGFIGQSLIPEMSRQGCDLLLLGRDQSPLEVLFPDIQNASYEALPKALEGIDIFVNLAVINNDSSCGLDRMMQVNADFAAELAQAAKTAGIKRFVNISSIHALNPDETRPYAVSKRAGVEAVDRVLGEVCTHVYLPAMIGPSFAGALRPLNSLPKPIAQLAIGPLSALKPLLPVKELADWVIEEAPQAGKHVILTSRQLGNAYYSFASRSLDIIAAIGGLAALSPLLLATGLAIMAQRDGPAVFAQTRIGRYGKPFTCYKFRTMAVGTAQAGTHEVSGSAVTKLGARLRKWKIDELPQLWNVLKGEMSLIGPRPCLPSQEELAQKRKEAGVLDIRPGISGLAQIAGIDMSDPARLVEWDARYISIRGLILDLKLILMTAKGGGRGDRVATSK